MCLSLKISNLPKTVARADIEGMFALIGNVTEVEILYEPSTGASLGVAVVKMSTIDEAKDCVLHYNGQTVDGHTIFVRENKPHVPDPNKKTISQIGAKQKRS